MKYIGKYCFLSFLLLVLMAPAVHADDTSPRIRMEAASLSGFDGGAGGTVRLGIAYKLKQGVIDRAVWLRTELMGIYFSQDCDDDHTSDAAGAGANLLLRVDALDVGPGVVFAEAGIGISQMSHPIPDRGTKGNFMPQAAIGYALPLSDTTWVELGMRYMHFSNASLWGDDNPGQETLGGFLGLSMSF